MNNDKMLQYFHSNRCMERYQFAVSCAEKINKLLDSGCIVFDENGDIVKGRFVFIEEDGTPCLNLQTGTVSIMYACDVVEDDGKFYLLDDNMSNRGIRDMFNNFKFVLPRDIRTLNLKGPFN